MRKLCSVTESASQSLDHTPKLRSALIYVSEIYYTVFNTHDAAKPAPAAPGRVPDRRGGTVQPTTGTTREPCSCSVLSNSRTCTRCRTRTRSRTAHHTLFDLGIAIGGGGSRLIVLYNHFLYTTVRRGRGLRTEVLRRGWFWASSCAILEKTAHVAVHSGGRAYVANLRVAWRPSRGAGALLSPAAT